MSRVTPFHLVDMSPWPLLGSTTGLAIVASFLGLMNGLGVVLLFFSLVLLFFVCLSWWTDVTRESTFLGFHTSSVQNNLLVGMVWFIVSEVFFFFSFFWTFAHSGFDPNMEVGVSWPPTGIGALDPVGVPLLNTLVLLSSGFLVTWAHYSLLCGDWGGSVRGMVGTISLGVFFTLLQISEYLESGFSISDSAYGSIFFLATGFHGFHVLVGSIFLLVSLFRMLSGHFGMGHHVSLECSIWYWHFVDVVWIFLYMFVYMWGSGPF